MCGLTPFEQAVVDAFLVGDDPRLATLRAQSLVCTVTGRRHTGVGSFTDLSVPDSAPRLAAASITLGDVDVTVPGVENGQTALLFVRDGVLSLLEFATYTGTWPLDPQAERIGYFRYVPNPTSGYTLLPVPQRDAETISLQLAGQ